ncbi:hypothetical protein SPAR76_0564 [Streptococcus pneumoniae GA43264]|nr:hypothetical protein SP187300_0662 [Streptococcus pneumoniae CDC1873-00]EDT98233.1 hypothetical protein SPMLV016_0504 [Streptococcus pneumoniae MLV-016]EGJ17803.1 hypothetical protein SPAR93_0607 [Streptococcus pneumoniae GA47368]EHD47117.1 hypothetical protein SPAR84_0573 [Streptococcus pneumoniae GA44452]EHD60878.1 hypothetical protein SPAR70_0483 [Streptococcus pneumoniae GA41410]EHE16681.1 hypothetical protein SPAR56_0765 [Streptococcus pneumoniae GA19077]EHE23992.1 hypothetical protei
MKEREVLTSQRLNELEINGIRLTKFKNEEIVLNLSGLIPKIPQAMPSAG